MDADAVVTDSRANAHGNFSEEEMRRWLTIILLLVWVGVAEAQTTPPMCSITGNVVNADGTPYVGVIKFYNPVVQVINTIPINPMQVSTATNSSGVIQPISLPQGAFFQVTICPNASSSSGCAATFTAIVPTGPTANFGNMAMGTNLSPGSSITASSLSVSGPSTFTGVMTFPDGSTYTTAGHNNMKALGIGAAAPTTGNTLLQITNNVNGASGINVTNSSAGVNANSTLNFVNDAGKTGWIGLNSSTYTGQGPNQPPNAFQIGQTGAGGMVIATDSNTSPGPPLVFWSGTAKVVTMSQIGSAGGVLTFPNTGSSSLYWGNTSTPSASILGWGSSSSLYLSGGTHYNGSNWIADVATPSTIIASGTGTVNLYVNSGLTVGNSYVPGVVGAFGAYSVMLNGQLKNNNLINGVAAAYPTVTNGTLGTGSSDSVGEISGTTGDPVTLTFSHCYTGTNVACVAADDGQMFMWAPLNKGNCGTSFQCRVTSTGAVCPTGQYFNYICMGFGG